MPAKAVPPLDLMFLHRDAAWASPRAVPTLPAILLTLCAATAALGLPAKTLAKSPDPSAAPGGAAGSDAIASAFGLTPPVRIGFCEEHPQDGTLGVTLVDGSGRQFPCGLDVGGAGGIDGARRPSARPRPVFVGATFPTLPAARRLPLWGSEERALMQLLTVAIADSISDAQNDLLLKGARSGILSDPGGFGLLRLIGSVERRRRMLSAITEGDAAPVADALAYFGLSGSLTVKRIELDRSDRLRSITIADARGQEVVASPGRPDGKGWDDAWLVDLDRLSRRFYVPLGGYEERYLLTLLSTAIRASGGPLNAANFRPGSAPDSAALKAATKTIQYRKSRIREMDRFG